MIVDHVWENIQKLWDFCSHLTGGKIMTSLSLTPSIPRWYHLIVLLGWPYVLDVLEETVYGASHNNENIYSRSRKHLTNLA
jgi:hypothetical protein